MSIVQSEGFDLIDSNTNLIARGWGNAEGSISATGNQFGGRAYTVGSQQNMILSRNALPDMDDEPFVGIAFWVRLSNLTGTPSGNLLVVSDGGFVTNVAPLSNSHFSIKYGANGSLDFAVQSGTSSTNVAGLLVAATWHHIEVRARVHSTLGTYEVWVGGTKVVDLTNVDTQDVAGFGGSWNLGACNNVTSVRVDDIVISSDASAPVARVLNHRIETLLPTGAGVNSDFTGTFADVDDPFGSSDGDTTNVQNGTLNNKQDYGYGNLTGDVDTVLAVVAVTEARKTDAGAQGLSPFVISNGTTETGTEISLAETFGYDSFVLEQDPNAAAAWTESTVNASTFGFEVTAV